LSFFKWHELKLQLKLTSKDLICIAGGDERMLKFPRLLGQELTVTGEGQSGCSLSINHAPINQHISVPLLIQPNSSSVQVLSTLKYHIRLIKLDGSRLTISYHRVAIVRTQTKKNAGHNALLVFACDSGSSLARVAVFEGRAE
jgi:hypothetical protein